MTRVIAALLVLVAAVTPSAQRPPSFDTASVKQHPSGPPGPRLIRPSAGGLFTAVNAPLSDLILFAYGLPGLEFRATGVPSWATNTFYDVTARMDASHLKPDGSFSMDDLRAMVMTLLQDRFKLLSRMEQRNVPVYALVKARADGALGPHLQQSGVTCLPIVFPAGIPPPPPPPFGPGQDAATLDFNCTGLGLPGHIFMRRAPMARFADSLSLFVRRVVVDRTGLEGLFDADLAYFPDPAIAQQGVIRQQPGAGPPPGIDSNAPEIFTAIEEQLGLKLESTRGPVDMVIVDSVEHPAEN